MNVSSNSRLSVLDQLESLRPLSPDQKASAEIKIKNTWTGGQEVAVSPMKGKSSIYGSIKAYCMPSYVATARAKALTQFKNEIMEKYGAGKSAGFKKTLEDKFDTAFEGQASLLAGVALTFIDEEASQLEDTTFNKGTDLATNAAGQSKSVLTKLWNFGSKQVTGKSVSVEKQLEKEGSKAIDNAMVEIDTALNKINKDPKNTTSEIRQSVFEVAVSRMTPLAKQIVKDMVTYDKKTLIDTSLNTRKPLDVRNATQTARAHLQIRDYKLADLVDRTGVMSNEASKFFDAAMKL